MPETSEPKSRYFNAKDCKDLKPAENVWVVVDAFVEGNFDKERLTGKVNNEKLGDKLLYEFKGKLQEFFDAFGTNTDNWVGAKFRPVPQKKGDYFQTFEVIHATEEKV